MAPKIARRRQRPTTQEILQYKLLIVSSDIRTNPKKYLDPSRTPNLVATLPWNNSNCGVFIYVWSVCISRQKLWFLLNAQLGSGVIWCCGVG
jgi:hypothetical protein